MPGHTSYNKLCDIIDALSPYLWRVLVPHNEHEIPKENASLFKALIDAQRYGDLEDGWRYYHAGGLFCTPRWRSLQVQCNAMRLKAFAESWSNDVKTWILRRLFQRHGDDYQNLTLVSGWYLATSCNEGIQNSCQVLVLPGTAQKQIRAFLGWKRRHQSYTEEGGDFPPPPDRKHFVEESSHHECSSNLAWVGAFVGGASNNVIQL